MSSSLRQGAIFGNLTAHQLAKITNIPVLLPPPGVRPNFDNPESNSQTFFVVTSILLVIATLLTANRVYAKTCIIRKYTTDDFVGLIAVIFTITSYVVCVWGTTKGKIWVHRWNLSVADVASKDFQIPIWFFAAFNAIAIGTIRVTFFLAYLHIFGPKKWLRIQAYTGIIFTALYHVSIAIVVFVLTTPARGQTWFIAITTENYQRFLKLLVPAHVIGFTIDLWILTLPIVAVWNLQMPTRKKIGICLIFMTGVMACIASILTIYYRHRLVETADVTWALMPVCTVTLAEMFVGIVVLCMPAAARSCRHHTDFFHKVKSSFGSKVLRRDSNLKDSTNGHRRSESYVSSNGPYSELGGMKTILNPPFAHTKGPRTVVKSGSLQDVDDEGIHLTFEMKSTIQNQRVGDMNV